MKVANELNGQQLRAKYEGRTFLDEDEDEGEGLIVRVEWKSKRPVEIPAKSWFQQYLCVTNLTKGASPDEECNYFINAEMHKMILAAEEANNTSSNDDAQRGREHRGEEGGAGSG